MYRAPIAAAFLVLSALTLVGLAGRQVQAVLATPVVYAGEASAGCPYAGGGDEAARLPPGHPPVDGPAQALPPGHPPVGQGRQAAPRFDREPVIDI